MRTVAVMGAGSWGTTLAKVFADGGSRVNLWARRQDVAQEIQISRENRWYLPGLQLPRPVTAYHDPLEALHGAEIVVLAVPSQTLRTNLADWKNVLRPGNATIVSVAKGIEKGTHLRMSEVIAGVLDCEPSRVTVLSGPNLSREVALEQPAATVIAGTDIQRTTAVQQAVAAPYFRPYTNTDVTGVEIGGACKNVVALACGIATGVGLGQNSTASLITRGLAEITRLGVTMGADARTFAGLAGIGDLVATCSSPLSRNNSFGRRLGLGDTVDEAMKATHGQIAEGIVSSESICELAAIQGVDMPITTAVHKVCHEGLAVDEMILMLMGRRKKAE